MTLQQAIKKAQRKANDTGEAQIVFKTPSDETFYTPGYAYCESSWYYDNPYALIDEKDYITTVDPDK